MFVNNFIKFLIDFKIRRFTIRSISYTFCLKNTDQLCCSLQCDWPTTPRGRQKHLVFIRMFSPRKTMANQQVLTLPGSTCLHERSKPALRISRIHIHHRYMQRGENMPIVRNTNCLKSSFSVVFNRIR